MDPDVIGHVTSQNSICDFV